MSNFIDLARVIQSATYHKYPLSTVKDVLLQLDENPDQVPGRTAKPTVTVSEVTEAAGTAHADLVIRCIEYMDLATVALDPEPTNAEKLETLFADLMKCQMTYKQAAAQMDMLGVKAPGADSASNARSDAAWELNIDRQGGA